jgi:hypothetical protein
MAEKSPMPAATGDRADNGFASHASFTRPHIQNQARRRHVERLHHLGPRVVYELLDEIARHHDIGADVDRRIARYAELDPTLLAILGGDRFPASPMRLVRS